MDDTSNQRVDSDISFAQILFSNPQGGSGSFLAEITGTDFLSFLLSKNKVEEKLKETETCKYTKPPLASLNGLLAHFGLYKLDLTNDQMYYKKLRCIGSIIKIEDYIYDGVKTEAFSVIVTHRDALFAAFLANSVVDAYFEHINEKKKKQALLSCNILLRHYQKQS